MLRGQVLEPARAQVDPSTLGTSQKRLSQLVDAAASNQISLPQPPQVVAHSPYVRAVETARALFPSFARSMIEVPSLHERNLTEFFFPWLLQGRIDEVKKWLNARPEKVVALVGHGQFFRQCLGARGVQRNVSVLDCTSSPEAGFQAKGTVYHGFDDPPGWREQQQQPEEE